MKKPKKRECFYCGCLINGATEMDHFPVPKTDGGILTVPCCVSCHDMKDRFNLDSWPEAWVSATIEDFPKFKRETRLLLAKVFKVLSSLVV